MFEKGELAATSIQAVRSQVEVKGIVDMKRNENIHNSTETGARGQGIQVTPTDVPNRATPSAKFDVNEHSASPLISRLSAGKPSQVELESQSRNLGAEARDKEQSGDISPKSKIFENSGGYLQQEVFMSNKPSATSEPQAASAEASTRQTFGIGPVSHDQETFILQARQQWLRQKEEWRLQHWRDRNQGVDGDLTRRGGAALLRTSQGTRDERVHQQQDEMKRLEWKEPLSPAPIFQKAQSRVANEHALSPSSTDEAFHGHSHPLVEETGQDPWGDILMRGGRDFCEIPRDHLDWLNDVEHVQQAEVDRLRDLIAATPKVLPSSLAKLNWEKKRLSEQLVLIEAENDMLLSWLESTPPLPSNLSLEGGNATSSRLAAADAADSSLMGALGFGARAQPSLVRSDQRERMDLESALFNALSCGW